ncbi:MAG TPA: LTA synthase family protein [Mobilitalea sp.]|nr:LTA synthase family protein [Mobilitalea sp.]
MGQDKLNIKLNYKSGKEIPVYLLGVFYLFTVIIYMTQEPVTSAKVVVLLEYLLLWAAVTLLSMLEISAVRSFLKKHAIWINGLVLVLSPVVSFVMTEVMVSNFNLKMFEAYSLYNVIWYIIIYYMIYALLRNAKRTVILCNLIIYLVAMLNYLVYLFRGNPILPSDLLAWRTGVSVASNYQLYFSKDFLTATLIMLFVFVLGYKLEKREKKPSIINRALVLFIFMVFTAFVCHEFFDTDLIKTKIKVIDFFAPKYTYCSYGTAFGFVANVQAMETNAPDGYSVDSVRKALTDASASSEYTSAADTKPNIIVIMNEAFSDLSMVGDYKTNQDYLPFIHSLEKNTIKGTLYSSVFGGGTSDTEYEFLTGNSMAVMPRNCVPYQQFVTKPTDSLANTLKAQGYYNIAIHPYKPSGYKRDLVYPLLGFDEFLSMDDFTNPQLIRSFISDRESYKKIIEQYENKKQNGPLFIFNVTMQNHGGYNSDQIFSDAETVRLTDLLGYKTVEQYLSLLRESDKAFQSLVDYFSKQKEPTIILLFGDHQPIAYSSLYDNMTDQTKANELKYQVPFVLWANYDIPKENVDKLSANYLSSYLLKTAGLKGTAYNDYLLKLSKEIPVINALFYIDKDGNIHGQSDKTSYYDMVNQYKYVGYNDALDKKNKLKEFFYLP